ncbi:MAG: ABC transporter permease, partial [Eubacterium sp.]|nr:ABC transporter permease [Eubacterium sp.]
MMRGRIYLKKRIGVPVWYRVLNPVLFVILALIFSGIFLVAVGFNPLTVYGKMLKTICSASGLKRSIEAGIPLMLTGLAV